MNTNKKRNKLIVTAIMTALLVSPMAYSVSEGHAVAATSVSKYKVNTQPFSIEGKKSSIGTINKNGSTYIALRNLNTALGLTTNFNKAIQLVSVSGNGRSLEVNLVNNAINLNGQPVIGPQVILQDNTTYLPLRFLLERMGYVISYQNSTKEVSIQGIKENDLQVKAEEIGADGDGKSLLVYYPVIKGYGNEKVQHKINTFLKQETDKRIMAGSKEMDAVVKANNQLLAKNPKAAVRLPSFDGRFTVTYNENGKLSLYVDYYLYMGGAHGITARIPYTFDLTTGDLISLKDAAGNADYVSIINSQIQKQISSRNLDMYIPFKTIEADRDYYLSHDGIVVYFTEYEYTSYSEGMPQFVIPYSKFK
ncbi:stalk domain-containing protein [Paenibacillus illinoisensis]|uniref:Copper amine oxidase domain-containing protein n=1 Tax=Paenibacillus illinoisensis TaxID=59845 RepID=A0A2W0C1F6_9BACL|nr:DUF4163 domain-containing protein [Paenibacillus illinoisensis]PYY25666.1 Uncharacterized protein PIL02S_06468 [Paenibacillus illinoisensis]